MKSLLLIFCLCGIAAFFLVQTACTKDKTDDEKIKEYIATKGWTAQTTPEGVYYVIDSLGIGTTYPTANSTVTVKYKGYLLDGTVFDANQQNGITYPLRQLIQGWQVGIPKFKKTGRGKLLIPSALGYGSRATGAIPANSVLIFEIELVNF